MIKAMKLKHVLFSSLFLSVGFTACTNDELVDVQAPVVDTENAVSLGEGYTIIATKAANEASRAYMESLNAAVWEKTDTIGAAWYDMITEYNEDGTVKGNKPFDGNKFSSYTWFKWDSQAGNNMSSAYFKSAANLSAGAYVLYYPYKKGELTYSQDGIPVSIATNQEMDCTEGNQLKGISKNIFAYAPVAFINGGEDQTREFKLNQLTNVLAISFKVDASDIFKLVKDVKIAKVIVKADNMVSDGIIPAPENVTAADYNAGKYGETSFVGTDGTEAEQIILDVKNASDAYTIKAIDTPTEYFYLSVLPLKADATSLTVQILTEDGKVYSKEMKNFDAFNELAKKEGQQIKLDVTLDKLEDVGTIYTADQFKTQWNAALTSTDPVTLTIGDGVDLSDVDLKLDKNVNVTLAGKSLKVKSLDVTNGSLTINNELTVAGDVTIGSNAKGFTTTDGVLSVEGNLNVAGTAQDVKVAKLEGLDVDASGVISIEGVKNTKGESIVELGTVNNEGTLTLKSIKVKDLTNTNFVEIADANVSNEGTITNNGTFTLSADFENNGTFNQNKTISGTGAFNNNAGATLNVNASFETQSAVAINNDAANVKDNLPAAVINVAKDKTLTVNNAKKLINNGIINVNGTIAEGSGALVQSTTDARINVANTGIISINQTTTGVIGGYVMVVKGSTVTDSKKNCKVVATEVTATTKAEDINTAADVYMMKGNFTDTQISTHTGKNLVFTGGTITLNETAVTLTGKATIAGDVTLALASDEASQRTFTISDIYGMTINAGAKLTIGEGVTLAGSSSATLTVEKGGSLVNNGTLATTITVTYKK